MGQEGVGRRGFLTGAGAATVAVVSLTATEAKSEAQQAEDAAAKPAGYTYFNPAEALFVEAAVDHMIPADEFSPSGTALGIAVYIDRALSGSWGRGDRLYLQGPWFMGTPNQGYQLPLTPAELYRAAIPACDNACKKAYGTGFAGLSPERKDAFLNDLSAGKITLEGGVPAPVFFAAFYNNVMEGMFSDPVYGGNKDKAGWKMIGFPGVMANNAENVKLYTDGRRFTTEPVSIADMS